VIQLNPCNRHQFSTAVVSFTDPKFHQMQDLSATSIEGNFLVTTLCRALFIDQHLQNLRIVRSTHHDRWTEY